MKLINLLSATALLSFAQLTTAAEIPSNDIAVFELELSDESVKVRAKPFHLTYRDGYDNQPKFSEDGQTIYFTRAIGQQTDIMQYSFADKSLANITQSEELSEYSATPHKEGTLSIIRVNQEGKQHLASLSIATGDSVPFTENLEPIGYHAWLDAEQAPVFVLGDVMTLQVLDTTGKTKPSILAENIGRCFERYSEHQVSFTLDVEGSQHIKMIDHNHALRDTAIVLPKGVQDYVWLNDESVIVGSGSKLLLVDAAKTREFADLSKHGIKNISRLAYSKSNGKLAVVYER